MRVYADPVVILLNAASLLLKMRVNKRYITLTDESQNATLTLRISDRAWDA